jgi:Phosphoketolase
MNVVDLVPSRQGRTAFLRQEMVDARAYTREHGEDSADISGWIM